MVERIEPAKKDCMSHRTQKLIRKIRNLIPKFECIPGCSDCCGPVMWNRWELKQLDIIKNVLSSKCPYSGPTGCEVYVHRPVVCRLFGATQDMECPHGKRPLKRLGRDDTSKLTEAYWNLRDFKVLGIDGWLNKDSDQESLAAVMTKIRAVVKSGDTTPN
jgi:uncharacterized protein